MRRLFILNLLLVITVILNAQFGVFYNDFEDWQTLQIEIDTISNPNNIWYIGKPTKPTFNLAYSEPNCILTDSSDYYPVNDTSSFIITHYADNGFTYPHTARVNGYYKIDSDSLHDFGMIEFSPNNGRRWYDLTKVDFADDIWNNRIPVLTGHIDQWTEFDMDLAYFTFIEDFQQGDTVLIKFTFISDSIQNNREGWLIDNIIMNDVAEGIRLTSSESFASIAYPNPANDHIEIKFPASGYSEYLLHIYDTSGRIILSSTVKGDGSIVLGTEDIGGSGAYLYHIYDEDSRRHSTGKFQIQ